MLVRPDDGGARHPSQMVDDLAPPATLAISKDGLTVYLRGEAILHAPRVALTGIAQRCLIAWHEGLEGFGRVLIRSCFVLPKNTGLGLILRGFR